MISASRKLPTNIGTTPCCWVCHLSVTYWCCFETFMSDLSPTIWANHPAGTARCRSSPARGFSVQMPETLDWLVRSLVSFTGSVTGYFVEHDTVALWSNNIRCLANITESADSKEDGMLPKSFSNARAGGHAVVGRWCCDACWWLIPGSHSSNVLPNRGSALIYPGTR